MATGGVFKPGWWLPGVAPHDRHAVGEVPAWAVTAERVVQSVRPISTEAEEGWQESFARIFQPFVDDALAELPAPGVAATLGRRLARMAARALVTELHKRKGKLAGADSGERFLDFVRTLGLADFLTAYPVLARLLAQASTTTAEVTRELIGRLTADRADLVATLLDGVDPGPVTAITAGLGELHNGGRSVTFVDFADGRRVVYKPRDVSSDVWFGELLAWLPELELVAAKSVTRPGYGWCAYVGNEPLDSKAAAERFYWRQGALLAVMHVLRATDVHHGNLVACGADPILVDAETLFHPEQPETGDPAADALAKSVHRTALLPVIAIGEQGLVDLSGLGGDTATSPTVMVDWFGPGTDRMRLVRVTTRLPGGANRPRLGSCDLDPDVYQETMIEGFRAAYSTIAARREQFAERVRACGDLEVRMISRPTWQYTTLLDETTHPDVLRDAADRDRALSVLYTGHAGDPIVAQEIVDLWAGDVPRFGEKPLLQGALDTIHGLSDADRDNQEWIIRAAMATRLRVSAHPSADPIAASSTDPGDLLCAARQIGDQLIARAYATPDTANWLGMEAVDERQWLVLPLGASLCTGYLGVAVFLAQLAKETGDARYADVACQAMTGILPFVAAVDRQPDLAMAIGGGLHGLGGVTFGLARLGKLLDDQSLVDASAAIAKLVAIIPEEPITCQPEATGWCNGLAGRLLDDPSPEGIAQLAEREVRADLSLCHGEMGILDVLSTLAAKDAVAHRTRLVADVLRRHGPLCGTPNAVPTPNLLTGLAGIGYGLLRLVNPTEVPSILLADLSSVV